MPPQKPKRRIPWLKILLFGFIGLIIAAVGLFAAAKASFDASMRKPDPDVTMEFSFNSWMSDAYGEGLGDSWETTGDFIGASADRKQVLTSELIDPTAGGRGTENTITRIHDTATGEVLHEFHKQYDCHASMPSIDGKVYCIKSPAPGVDPDGNEAIVHELGALDVATGKFEPFYNAPFSVVGLKVFGVKDGKIFAGTNSSLGHNVIAFNGDGTIAWQVEGINFLETRGCRLAGPAIGCELPLKFVALNQSDGSLIFDEQLDGAQNVVWSDQGVAVGGFFAESRDVWLFDKTRETTEKVVNSVTSGGSLVPEPVLAHEFMLSDDVLGDVGIDGKNYAKTVPSGFFMESGINLLETGAFIPRESPGPILVSEHGKAFIPELGLTGTTTVFDDQGQEVGTLPEGAMLVDGLFHVPDRDGQSNTVVVPPAG